MAEAGRTGTGPVAVVVAEVDGRTRQLRVCRDGWTSDHVDVRERGRRRDDRRVAPRRRPDRASRRPRRDGPGRTRPPTMDAPSATASARRSGSIGSATDSGPRTAVDRRGGGAGSRAVVRGRARRGGRRARQNSGAGARRRSGDAAAASRRAAAVRCRSIDSPGARRSSRRSRNGSTRRCAGQPRVVSVSGAAGTGTATLLRQLESEVRLRGGLFAIGRVAQASAAQAVRRVARAPSRDARLPAGTRARMGRAATPRAARSARRRPCARTGKPVPAARRARPTTCDRSRRNGRSCSCSTRCSGPTRTSWDALEHLIATARHATGS